MNSTKIDIKPLSVNSAYKGRRYRTNKYSKFAQNLTLMLPKKLEIPKGRLEIKFRFGFSSKLNDWDNCIKSAQDVICKKYGFDDRIIFKGTAEKEIVPKGKEYIEFEIMSYKNRPNEETIKAINDNNTSEIKDLDDYFEELK